MDNFPLRYIAYNVPNDFSLCVIIIYIEYIIFLSRDSYFYINSNFI